jgi:hypothetical protein
VKFTAVERSNNAKEGFIFVFQRLSFVPPSPPIHPAVQIADLSTNTRSLRLPAHKHSTAAQISAVQPDTGPEWSSW